MTHPQIQVTPSTQMIHADPIPAEGTQPQLVSSMVPNTPSNAVLHNAYAKLGDLPNQIQQRFQQLRRNGLTTYYSVGQLMVAKRRELDLCSTYCKIRRIDFLELLSSQVNVSPRTLDDCYRFAMAITPEQFQRLETAEISWTKIRSLFAAPTEMVEVYLTRLLEEDLSEQDLRKVIKQENPQRKIRKPRCRKPPKSLTAALEMVQKIGGDFYSAMNSVLFGDTYDLVAEMINGHSDSVNDSALAQAEAIATLLHNISRKAAENARGMEAGIARFRKELKNRQEASSTNQPANQAGGT